MMLLTCELGYMDIGVGAHGMAQIVFVSDGSALVVGMKPAMLKGSNYAQKLKSISNATQEALCTGIDNSNAFTCFSKPGHMMCIPAVYMTVVRCISVCTMFKWSWMAVDPPAQELREVLSNCTHMTASFPSMALGPFQTWVALLHERLHKCQ